MPYSVQKVRQRVITENLEFPALSNDEPGLKPPLKWAGGKRWLIPTLLPIWESHKDRRLVEPFCGGLAVALGLLPKKALLNDINPHSINFYSWIQSGLRTNAKMENDEDVYYMNRERFNHLIRNGKADSREAATLFYYLNRTGFNGLCRFNKQGEFNVPFGKYKNLHYTKNFLAYQRRLSKWEFTIGDFKTLNIKPNDFIYADPPYDVEFTQYAKEGFNFEDQKRLAKWLAEHPGPVVASNQATDRIIELYESNGFRIEYLQAPRRISCTGDRSPAKEILATKGI